MVASTLPDIIYFCLPQQGACILCYFRRNIYIFINVGGHGRKINIISAFEMNVPFPLGNATGHLRSDINDTS